jgi:hypothetical protein
MKRIELILVMLMLMVSTSMAWEDMKKPLYYEFIDSNAIIDLKVNDSDTTEYLGQSEWIDTTYHPNKYGRAFGWPEQILIRYGIAFIDTSQDYSATDADSLGVDLAVAVVADSAHIALGIQASLKGYPDYWCTIWMDSTLRAATDMRTTHSHLIDVDDLLVNDTLYGGNLRAFSYIYRTLDSTGSWYPISDTAWLDGLEVWGFGYESKQTVGDYYTVELAATGTALANYDDDQADGNVRDSAIGDPVFLEFVPQIVRVEYGISYLTVCCSLGIDNDSGAPFWTIETRDDMSQPWRSWTLDSMHNVRDSFFNLTNDFADQDDTVWGRWMRVIEQFEMDCDKDPAAGSHEYDTVIFNGVKVHYYRNIK